MKMTHAGRLSKTKPNKPNLRLRHPNGQQQECAGKLSAARGSGRLLCQNGLRIHRCDKCGRSPQLLACAVFPRAVLYSQYATPTSRTVPSTALTGSLNGKVMPTRLSSLEMNPSMSKKGREMSICFSSIIGIARRIPISASPVIRPEANKRPLRPAFSTCWASVFLRAWYFWTA